MSANDRSDGAEPLAIDGLLTEDQRRLEIATGAALPIELLDPPNKRSERETNRVLAILDELERGTA